MATGMSLPGQPEYLSGLPSNFAKFPFEGFETLNTKPLRPGLQENECYWLDGIMPLGPSNARILPGTGTPVYTAPSGKTIVWHNFGNIANTPYMAVLLSDGSLQAVNMNTLIVKQIAAASTITNPSTILGFSQWGSLYLIFAKDQTNGYWLWDGSHLYNAGTVGPVVELTNGGLNYTSAPTITVQTTGAGTGVTFSTVIENGSITQVLVTNPGSGFGVDDFINLAFTGGGTDNNAIGVCNVSTTSGGVNQVIVQAGGQGYTGATTVYATGGGGSGASFAPVIGGGGAITSVAIISRGTGYTSPPDISAEDPGYPGSHIEGGSGFAGVCTIELGQITSIDIINQGSNYVSPPVVTIIGDGENASVEAQINGSGQVTNFLIQNSGGGYTKALASITGGNNAASATIALMPYGVSGTSVEIYQGSVWVSNGAAVSNTPPKNRVIFSTPGSPVDFGDAGGAFGSDDSFLRVGYHCLKQTNGFLYLIGDSSINYISGVQTSTPSSASVSPQAVTTFGNQNVDPQLGSPWPSSVQVFSRNIVFANSIGIFVSYGGAVTKVSIPLDGFYGTGPIYGNTSNYSSAVANIFGVPVYMLLLPIVNPFTSQSGNWLLMWDGKRWFTSQQDRTLTYVSSQEINSVLTAWGTDGTHIFPLFDTPTTNFPKVIQSRLSSGAGYFTTKTETRLHGVVYAYAVDDPMTITIDSEVGLGTNNALQIVPSEAGGLTWTNDMGETISWGSLTWGGPGLDVFGPYPIAQQGRMVGLTVQTNASDLAFLSFQVTGQEYTINV